jgi:cytochrome c
MVAAVDPVVLSNLGKCVSCHTLAAGEAHGMAPNLWQIHGRKIASASGYPYTSSLRGNLGRWDAAELRTFLRNPTSFAPNTTMPAFRLNKQEMDEVIAALQKLQ